MIEWWWQQARELEKETVNKRKKLQQTEKKLHQSLSTFRASHQDDHDTIEVEESNQNPEDNESSNESHQPREKNNDILVSTQTKSTITRSKKRQRETETVQVESD